jgi:hypothetical protein
MPPKITQNVQKMPLKITQNVQKMPPFFTQTVALSGKSPSRRCEPAKQVKQSSYMISVYRSCHEGFIASINFSFFLREPAFICFSLVMAYSIVSCNS